MVRYICFCRMTPEFLRLPIEERAKYIPEWAELAEKHGLKVLFWGTTLGLRENVAVVFKSKEYSDNYIKFQSEWQGMGTPDAKRYVEDTRTITVF